MERVQLALRDWHTRGGGGRRLRKSRGFRPQKTAQYALGRPAPPPAHKPLTRLLRGERTSLSFVGLVPNLGPNPNLGLRVWGRVRDSLEQSRGSGRASRFSAACYLPVVVQRELLRSRRVHQRLVVRDPGDEVGGKAVERVQLGQVQHLG